MRLVSLRAISSLANALARLLPNFLGLTLAWFYLSGWEPGVPWTRSLWVGIVCVWISITLLADSAIRRRLRRRRRAFAWIPIAGMFGLAAAFRFAPASLQGAQFLPIIACALIGVALRRPFTRAVRLSRSLRGEALRWAAVAGVALFVIQPYATRGLVGGGDAQHYAQQLTDAIIQARQGVFPIFVGQSIYAYNGDIHPLRTAPYFQYAGVVLDAATGHRLGAPGVQNLLIVLSLLAAGLLTYSLGLRPAGRAHAWTACLLAVAFLACPGILALVYSGDMVASWMTLPFLPLLFFALGRAIEEKDPAPALRVAAGAFALIWLAHAPIAFWVSPLVALTLLAVARRQESPARGLWLAAGTGVLALALSAYVFVSVASLDVPDDPNLIKLMHQGGVMNSLRAGWSGWLRPVDPSGSDLLHNLQLSPILWLALLGGLVGLWKNRRATLPFWLYVALLLALIVPVSALAGKLWAVMPAAVIGPTEKWPTQRFYPILSALTPLVALLGLRALRWPRPIGRWILAGVLLAGCGSSLIDARKFIQRGRNVAGTPVFTAERFREENAILSRYSYEMYGRLPRYFSQGPMAPLLENRALAAGSLEIVQSNLRAILEDPAAAATPHALQLTDYGARFEPKLKLEPGQFYLVAFDFGSPAPEGVLELVGRTIYRQYPLSAGVEARAFQDRPDQEHGFLLWTTAPEADDVEIRFYATPGQPKPGAEARLRMIAVNPGALPLRLKSLLPYQLSATVARDGWLETPKLYVPGYAATVDGRPVASFRSPDGLLMLPVTAGTHEIALTYRGSWPLRAAFWFTLVMWALVAGRAAWPRRSRPEIGASTLIRLGQAGAALAAIGLCTVAVARVASRPAPASVLAEKPTLTLRLTFPVERDGASETLLTTREDGHEIAVFAHYADGQHVVLGFSRDGAPWLTSAPIAINYVLPHELEISWKGARAGHRLVIDQQVAVDSSASPAAAPGTPARLNFSEHPPTPFTGRILAADSAP